MLSTEQLIIMALEADPEMDRETVHAILYELKSPNYTPKPVPEKKAAEILGIPYTTLNNWRNRKQGREKFAFTIIQNPASSGVLYDEIELKQYIKNRFYK